jgi:signal transduction histidine kinase
MTIDRRRDGDRRRSRRLDQTRLRSIVERMADGVVVVGFDGVIRFANPAAEQLFGRSMEELLETPFGFPAVAGETAEIDVVRPGGSTVSAELRVVETEWEGEAGRLVSLRDVTDRKRAEERAAQLDRERVARVEAEAANHAKSQFLAMMSHELRTPLNAVIGYSELLDLGLAGALSTDQRHQVSRILAASRHLLSLVNEVLDLSRIEAGRLSVHSGVARAGQTADAALSIAQPVAESRGILLTGHCLGDVDSMYEGDEDRVRQILVNLLTNALKFTEPGGNVSIDCGITAKPDAEARVSGGPWVFLRVTDTGIGIAPEQLATIFDPFVQVEGGHTRPSDGSGLGLTISRRLARLMRGDLTVRSELGKGSSFTLWMPAGNRTTHEMLRARRETSDSSHVRGLAEIGAVLVRELEPILSTFVSRLRADAAVPRAQSLRFWQLADHVGTYIADLGGMLIALPDAGGDHATVMGDGTDIQSLVAERHGTQRAGLGWTPDALKREWQLLTEEVERAIQRRTRDVDERTTEAAIGMIRRFIEHATELSGRALARTLDEPNGAERADRSGRER